MKKTIFYLQERGGKMSLWHFIVLNLGGLYYIDNNIYNVRHNDSKIINDSRRVENPTSFWKVSK